MRKKSSIEKEKMKAQKE
ncbi:hypothetical protein A2U01_0088328, partial [Trifolium medium]|nr:hypothetical protein [Trifolium medium]